MSLNFASPVFLLGLLGIAVPVLIHLLTRRQQKHIRFSANYLLSQSQKRSIKKSAPNRLLLLLIRCLGIALLSLALANPTFSFGGAEDFSGSAPSANVFILDDSYSMATRTEDGSLYQQAVRALSILLGQMPAGSSAGVVLASAPGRVFQDWTQDRSTLEKILKATQPSYRTTRIGQALTRAFELLESAPQEKKRIFILTDMDKNGWDREEIPENPSQGVYPVKIIDFSDMASGPNTALVQSVEVKQEFLTNSKVIRVKTKLVNLSSDKTLNRLRTSLWVNGKKISEGYVDLPPRATADKEFSFPFLKDEPFNGIVQIQEDALPVDNRRFFTFQPDRKVRVLVVDGDPKTVAHQSESFYLEQALNPFSAAVSTIEPTVSTLAELPMRNLFDFSVVMLCNLRELPFDYELQLEKFVSRGGVLFVSLGDQVDPKYYNEKLGNLLPVTLESLHQIGREDEPFRLLFEGNKHPVMKIFTGKTLEEMKNIRFNSLYKVQPREDRPFSVALQFVNRFPAVIESESGKGKVILYVSSIDRDWNEFPIQPTFLPWIQRWIKYAARGLDSLTQQALSVGEPFVWKGDLAGSQIHVQTPGGKTVALSTKPGETRYEDTYRPGVYRLYLSPASAKTKDEADTDRAASITGLPQGAVPAGAFTVNIDSRESSPGKISQEEVRSLLPGMSVEFSQGKSPRESPQTAAGSPLATPFLLFFAGMLFIEGWMVRRE